MSRKLTETETAEIAVNSLIELFTNDPDETLKNETLLEIANDLLNSVGAEKLKLLILMYYATGNFKLETFKEYHERDYSLFTQLYGVAFWRD
ncbi:hypothetical protein KAR91_62710 [Candidatus Pacearchaeota archaeon]|nr:hypothetical protein [Candidatus Pacearchaeota archaeon]